MISSSIGEEFVSYNESTTIKGQYSPLIATSKYDGSYTFREIVKGDLVKIPDDNSPPGGWLFRKSQNTSSSWVKRFGFLRGDFLFLFHSPQNEKPIALIPLDDCDIVLPENNERCFDSTKPFHVNDGYEFDIKHYNRPTIRLQALSDQERKEWFIYILEHINITKLKKKSGNWRNSHLVYNERGNITITGTKLINSEAKNIPNSINKQAFANTAFMNPYMVPRGFDSDNQSENSFRQWNNRNYLQSSDVSVSDASRTGGDLNNLSFLSQNPNSGFNYTTTEDDISTSDKKSQSPGKKDTFSGGRKGSKANNLGRFNSILEAGLLEKNLQKKVGDNAEARERELLAKIRLSSPVFVEQKQEKEQKNPLSLAEQFRLSLFYIDEELAEDPQIMLGSVPHLKGTTVEEIVVLVYKTYCGESGFMSIENFVEFVEDTGVLLSHVEHDEDDEPTEEFKAQLDPVHLLTLVPRNYGVSTTTNSLGVTNEKLIEASEKDNFIINFGQFYQLLLRITEIIYSEIYFSDPTLAFNKFLQEIIIPLFVWCYKHEKRGSQDILVLEERILLLLTMYSPNIWKVFLTYAHDATQKVPEITLSFPESAQMNERGLFHLPVGAPSRHFIMRSSKKNPETSKISQLQQQEEFKHILPNNAPDSLFITEAGIIRFAIDYAIVPHVITIKNLKTLFKVINRPKTIVSSRLPTRDQVNKSQSPRKKDVTAPMVFGTGLPRTSSMDTLNTDVPPPPPSLLLKQKDPADDDDNSDDSPPPPPPPGPTSNHQVTGLGFSEFLEIIARIAVEGCTQPNYHVIFPTPFSKVLALLTVWGVADLEKLEEIRIMRSEDTY